MFHSPTSRFSRLLLTTTLFFLIGLCPVLAQSTGQKATPKAQVYTFVEQLPQFPGGQEALTQYMAKNLKYPASAKDQQISGKVFVQFVVDAQGRVQDAEVVKGLTEDLDQEARRIVMSMPPWTPGRQNGQAVAVRYTIPIEYRL